MDSYEDIGRPGPDGRMVLDFNFPVKRCYRCGRWLSLDMFGKEPRARDGLSYRCKPCDSIASHQTPSQRLKRVRAAERRAQITPKGALVSHDRLVALFSYNPETGELRWRHSGERAGTVNAHGYRRVTVDGRYYPEHRVIWNIMTGGWPERGIDHKGMNKSDNRWCELRLATKTQNLANTTARKNNKLGVKGVSSFGKKYRAAISVNGKQMHLGLFRTIAEAQAAYAQAAAQYFGEYARIA